MLGFFLICGVALLAYANGANDNFKGVATLFGSGSSDYRRAITWATVTTLLGSLAAVLLAGTLLKNFSGKGLVADTLDVNTDYRAAVALGAGLTVLLAARWGMPISTTHGLVGALVGAGLAAGSAIDMSKLGASFFLPLILSPLLSFLVTSFAYPLFRTLRRATGITAESCLCLGEQVLETFPAALHCQASERAAELSIQVGDRITCQNHYQGSFCGIEAEAILDKLHFLSGGAVSFARGLNDTPKIAALLLVLPLFQGLPSQGLPSVGLVGIAIALGGLLHARQVAETMSHKITAMNSGQGFTANLMTSLIVIGASRLGLPVSTTHVSCGALFGLGVTTRQAQWKTIGTILLAWVITLPAGAVFGAVTYVALTHMQSMVL